MKHRELLDKYLNQIGTTVNDVCASGENPGHALLSFAQWLDLQDEAHLTPVAGDGAKCRYCGSPMPKNEIRCKVCHP